MTLESRRRVAYLELLTLGMPGVLGRSSGVEEAYVRARAMLRVGAEADICVAAG